MKTLTEKQQRVLNLLVVEYAATGWPVSFTRMLELTGYASRATLSDHLRRLERYGLIEHSPNAKGGYRPALLQVAV